MPGEEKQEDEKRGCERDAQRWRYRKLVRQLHRKVLFTTSGGSIIHFDETGEPWERRQEKDERWIITLECGSALLCPGSPPANIRLAIELAWPMTIVWTGQEMKFICSFPFQSASFRQGKR
jgi:hypothetical protein